jgi:hypothetical protein
MTAAARAEGIREEQRPMDGSARDLADLLVTPGQRVTSTGWLEGEDDRE